MEFVSAVPFGKAVAFYRICKAYQNAFMATLERCVGPVGLQEPPPAVFFIKEESGCLGDAVHHELIQHLAISVDEQLGHEAMLQQVS